MKNILLTLLTLTFILGCSKDEEVVELLPVFEISLDGESFDPYERYSVISSYGGRKEVNGVVKKIFILFLIGKTLLN